MTKLPREVDSPEGLMEMIKVLRDGALKSNNFDYAVGLSHVHAWLYWLKENWEELNKK